MKELASIKVRVPNIKRLYINNAIDSDVDLKTFYEQCSPENLKLLMVEAKTTTKMNYQKFIIEV